MKEYNEELFQWLVEELWGSCGYNSPEEHAFVILDHIFDDIGHTFKEEDRET